jgi:CRP-like cAMP-binding protein
MRTADLVKKLQIRDALSPNEVTLLENLISDEVAFGRHDTIIKEGEHQTSSRLLLQGWVARTKILNDGRRQISQIHIAGDFVDLHSFTLKCLDHSIVALTDCRLGVVPHDALRKVTEDQPHLTRMLWLNTMIDAATHREWLTATGRLSAQSHIAHLICELYVRLQSVGLARDHRFDMLLTQEEIGDACGLTAVHVNRVMQELRARELIETKQRSVRIIDWDSLQKIGEFDPIYLNLWSEPR